MAASNDELARALEAMSSGQGEAPVSAPAEKEAQAAAPAAVGSEPAHPDLDTRRGSAASALKIQRSSSSGHSLFLRQTAIPPLLTLGTLMPLAGIASLVLGEESPLGEQVLVPALLILVGLLILGIAALNMLQVRQLLSGSTKR